MNHNITVECGASVRLKTAGKYCDRDIIVTAEGGADENYITETWTFTLEDGSIVDKAVVINA